MPRINIAAAGTAAIKACRKGWLLTTLARLTELQLEG
jgi:hypothetical protein